MQYDPERRLVLPQPKASESVALIHKGEEISYRELVDNINSYASLFEPLFGKPVAIVSENRPEWIYALYSIWSRGGTAVPIDFLIEEQDLLYILQEVKPAVVFCSDHTEEKIRRVAKDLELINFDRLVLPKPNVHAIYRELSEIALILYTSGTTGNPKGVMLSFKNLLSNIDAIKELNLVGSKDRTLAILPFHHSYPLMTTILVPLSIGASVVFLEKLSSDELLNTMRDYKPTVLVGVPRLYQMLEAKLRERLFSNLLGRTLYYLSIPLPFARKRLFSPIHKAFGGRLRFMVSGGAKLPLKTAKFFSRLGFKVIEGYGLTETSPIVSFNPPNRIKLGSVGIPIKGVSVKIDEDGQILVKGPNVMVGYYNKPEDTHKVFKEGYLMTGDLGYMDTEGYLYITGRIKEIIVLSGGKKVDPEEMESSLLESSKGLIKEVGILEIDGSLHALIVVNEEKLKELGIVNIEEYIKWKVLDPFNRSLPEWKRIVGYKLIKEELPKTRLGKLKRYKLLEIYKSTQEKKERRELKGPYVDALSSIIQSLTGKKPYADDHLEIDLGLDSLGKVELLAFIHSTFGLQITEEELSTLMRFEDLVRYIENHSVKKDISSVDWGKILQESKPFRVESHPRFISIGRLILKVIFKLYNRLEVSFEENLPSGGFILAPNHASYLDGFVLLSALPEDVAKRTYFLGEEEYFRGSLRSLFARFAHVITVNLQKDLQGSLQKTAWLLKLGKTVVIFPEGARTRDGRLLPFKKGFAILSKELSVPVVPVVIEGTFKAMPIGSFFPKPYKIRVRFLRKIEPNGKSYEEIVQETKKAIEEVYRV